MASLTDLPGVGDAVESARQAIADLHRHPSNIRGWARTSAAASVRAARASAMLDNGSGELDASATAITDPILAGALRVSAAIGRLAPVWRQAPLQALAGLHTLAAAGLETSGEPGRPRDRASADRLTSLAAAVTGSGWPGPVMVAVVHGELLARKPFGSADGVVARGAARLAMIGSGLDRRGLTVPEVGHLRSGSQYPELADGYATGDPAAIAAWIVEVCRCLEAGAREGGSIADAAS